MSDSFPLARIHLFPVTFNVTFGFTMSTSMRHIANTFRSGNALQALL